MPVGATSAPQAGPATMRGFSENDVPRLRDLLYEKLGLYLGAEMEPALALALEQRVAAGGGDGAQDYLDELERERLDHEELRRLLQPLLRGKRGFLVDSHDLRTFCESFLSPLAERAAQRGAGEVKVWSVCDAGVDEPYRIAALLRHLVGAEGGCANVRVMATHRDPDRILRARGRRFEREDLAGLPEELIRSEFEPSGDGWVLGPWAESALRVDKLDPAEPDETVRLGLFDAIFARHVLCHLMPESRQRVLALFEKSLCAGGLLFLGRGESPASASSSLRLMLYPGGAVYRKPLRG